MHLKKKKLKWEKKQKSLKHKLNLEAATCVLASAWVVIYSPDSVKQYNLL